MILGINCYAHDSAAALVHAGKIIAAAEEERFTRRKHTGEFPVQAIRYCLKEAGISARELRRVAFSYDPALQFRMRLGYGLRNLPRSLRFVRHSETLFLPFFLKEKLKSAFPDIRGLKIDFVNHHLAHAASSFFASPFERSAILTVDGSGEWTTTLLAAGEGNRITRLHEIHYPHSLGFLYGAITQFLGFRSSYDEGKVMALAAYGEPSFEKEFDELVKIEPGGNFRLNLKYFDFQEGSARWASRKLSALLGEPRSKEQAIEKRHYDIAASLQAVLEKALLHLAVNLYERTGLENLCLAGGVALNCSANGRLLRDSPFERIFVQPAAGDGGTALGAALFISHSEKLASRNGGLKESYLGPGFGESEMERALRGSGVSFTRPPSIEETAASGLSEGKVIGWFQGRMEFGPRALGGRSILADPRGAETRDHINREIKHREIFRPFAPSVLEENYLEFFEIRQKSPFMLFAGQTLQRVRSQIPAVLHQDGTARVQTVSREASPVYWELLQAFKRKTGIPVVLNTSFNLKDEPLVCTPEDAIRSFSRSPLDHLALGPFWVSKQ